MAREMCKWFDGAPSCRPDGRNPFGSTVVNGCWCPYCGRKAWVAFAEKGGRSEKRGA